MSSIINGKATGVCRNVLKSEEAGQLSLGQWHSVWDSMTNHDLDLRIFSSGCSRAAPSGLTQIPQVECSTVGTWSVLSALHSERHLCSSTCGLTAVTTETDKTSYAYDYDLCEANIPNAGCRGIHGVTQPAWHEYKAAAVVEWECSADPSTA